MKDFIIYPKAEKFLKKIKDKQLKEKFYKAIDEICDNPHIGEAKKGDLQGIFCKDVYHAGINYEVAYKIVGEEIEIIYIILAGVRGNFYEELKRYLKELDF